MQYMNMFVNCVINLTEQQSAIIHWSSTCLSGSLSEVILI